MEMIILTIKNELKICVDCGSSTTYKDPQGKERWEYRNHDRLKPLCKRCTAKEYAKNNPEQVKRNHDEWATKNRPRLRILNKRSRDKHKDVTKKANERRLTYKGKQVMLDKNPRIGICSECYRSVHTGEIKRTNMHHIEYDDSDVLAHTIELCAACHRKKHRGEM